MALLIQLSVLLTMLVIGLYLAAQHYKSSNILILGVGSKAAQLQHNLNSDESSKQFNVLGFVKSHISEDSVSPKLRFNSEQNLVELAKRLKTSTIVIAVDQRLSREWTQQLLDCKLSGIKIIDASSLNIQQAQSRSFSQSIMPTPKQV